MTLSVVTKMSWKKTDTLSAIPASLDQPTFNVARYSSSTSTSRENIYIIIKLEGLKSKLLTRHIRVFGPWLTPLTVAGVSTLLILCWCGLDATLSGNKYGIFTSDRVILGGYQSGCRMELLWCNGLFRETCLHCVRSSGASCLYCGANEILGV